MKTQKYSFGNLLILGLVTLSLASCQAEGLPSIPTDTETPSDTASAAPVTTACDLTFSRSGLCASVTFDSAPNSENENAFTLKFYSQVSGTPETGPFIDPTATVSVKLWMPSMGHGSSPVTLTRSAEGTYRATRVFFVMPGDWEIRVLLKTGTTVVDQASLFFDHID